MSPEEAVASAAGRLVGGVMFHSEHADLCWYMGLDVLAKENEDGYRHDSKCLRRLHRLSVSLLGVPVRDAAQERSGLLDQYAGTPRWSVSSNVRKRTLERVLTEMVEWEVGTCETLGKSYSALLGAGEMTLSDEVGGILADTEGELAGYRSELARFQSVNWDLELAMWGR